MSGIQSGQALPGLVGTHDPGAEVFRHLPLGRWSCTEQDILEAFDVPNNSRRSKLWDDWQEHRELVRAATGAIVACWLSGTFFTSKADPSDLDCVYILPASRVAQLSERENAVFGFAFAGQQVHGLELDAYPLFWDPFEGAQPQAPGADKYVYYRGYWDCCTNR